LVRLLSQEQKLIESLQIARNQLPLPAARTGCGINPEWIASK
jgi:hypothetical protein